MRFRSLLTTFLVGAAMAVAVPSADAAPFAFISHWGESTVAVVDLATNTVTATIPVCSNGGPVTLSPDGSRAYVFCYTGSLSSIDTQSLAVTTVDYGPDLFYINGLAVTPDGRYLYAAGGGNDLVWQIDAASLAIVSSFHVPNSPPYALDNHNGIAFNPSGTRLYVTQYGFAGTQQNISIVDTATHDVIGNIDLGLNGPGHLAMAPDGSYLLVAQYARHVLLVVDLATNSVVATVPVGLQPAGVALNNTATRAYVTGYIGNDVTVVDTATWAVVATIPVGGHPVGVSVTSDGRRVVVVNEGSNSISVIDASTNTVSTTVPVGSAPSSAAGRFVTSEPLPGDATPPVLTLPSDIVVEAAGPDGTAVSFTATAIDDVDGNVPVSCVSASGSVFGLGSTTVNCSADDLSGNQATGSFTVTVVDGWLPQVTCVQDDGSWHPLNVTIACQAEDYGSGLADPALALFTLATSIPKGIETTDAWTTSIQVCDVAGNCVQVGPFAGIRVDRRLPSADIVSPRAGSSYPQHSTVLASYSCIDGGSGVATCEGLVPTGAALDTSTLGVRNFQVTIVDAVGNLRLIDTQYTITPPPPPLTWREVQTAIAPEPRAGHKMVYDSVNHKVLLFGGYTRAGVRLNDVWEFDTATETWTDVTPADGPMPSGRSRFGMAFDRARNVVVVYGGNVDGSPGTNDETWEWNPAYRQWSYRGTAGNIDYLGRVGVELAFDPNLNKVILFGGVAYWACPTGNGTYAWDGAAWSLVGDGAPVGRNVHAMATDFDRSRVVLYGGTSSDCGSITDYGDTWEWNGSSWVSVASEPNRPSTHLGVQLDFDSVNHELVAFGGYATNESWVWQGNTWTLKSTTGPSARISSIVFDPVQNVFVVFGGHEGGFQLGASPFTLGLGETWVATRREPSALSVAPASAPYGSTVEVAATLATQEGEPLPGRSVRFQLDASQYPATTGVDGVARAQVDLGSRVAGSYTLSAAFDGDTLFAASTGTNTLTITKAVPAVSWSAPGPIVYGTALSAAQLNAASSVAGTFTYAPPAGTILTAGAHQLEAIFTPADSQNYESRSVFVSIDVLRAVPSVAWSDPAPIEYGQPLGATQLNASANVPGTFTYLPVAGTIPGLGTHTLTVIFSPADQVNYTASSASAQLVVTQAHPSVNLSVGRITAFSHLVTNLFAMVQVPPGAAPPTGTLEFLEGTQSLGVMPVGSRGPGGATILLTPTPGAHSYTARYSGDANYAASASAIAPASFEAPPQGTVRGWGDNWFGQLADGNTESRPAVAVSSRNSDGSLLSDVVAMAAGFRHTVIVRADGSAWAWGGNWYGEVGDGTLVPRINPVRVLQADGQPFTGVSAVAVEGEHSAALKQDGTVWTWGLGSVGRLGNGASSSSSYPVQVITTDGTPLTGIVAIDVASPSNVALRFDGTVWTWGWNASGQLGDGTTTDRSRASRVLVAAGQPLSGVMSIWAGYRYAFAIGFDGTSWGWGDNNYGQLGDGTQVSRSFATQLPLSDVWMFAGGGTHALALKTDYSVWSWGSNSSGQLGKGTFFDFRLSPGPVLNQDGSQLTGVTQIEAAFGGGYAVRGGQIWGWGENSYSQLGDGSTTNRAFPTFVRDGLDDGPLLNASLVAVQSIFGLALTAPPAIALEGSVDFGDQLLGANVLRTLTLRSAGAGVLRLGSAFVTLSDFAITQKDCANALLSPGSSCNITVRFTPTAGGSRSTILFQPTNVASGHLQSTLTGNGVQPVAVTVDSPNGGERVFTTTPVTIRWTASGTTTSFDVDLSRDGGATYAPIAACTSLPATATSCQWTPTTPASTTARVRVTARNAFSNAADASDANFTIVAGAPSITVTSPNTAVSWVGGSTHAINWSHNIGLALVRIDLSRDGGATWTVLAPSVRNTTNTSGTFSWRVTGPPSASALIRVTALDLGASDVSNVPFSVVLPAFTVTAPNTAVTWSAGSSQTITWSHNTGATERMHLDVSRDGGASWETLATNVSNATAATGTYPWVVTGPATANARVRVRWVDDAAANDMSNVSFTIATPTVTVTSINTAVSVRAGSTQTLRVTHNIGAGQTVAFDLTRDNGATWNQVATAVTTATTSASVNWVVPGPITTQARIRARWTANPSVEDQGDTNFTITSRITVTQPNTAVVWGAGSTRLVSWTHNLGTSEPVNIDVSSDGGATWRPVATGVVNATASSGSYTGPIPGPAGSPVLIRVSQASDPTAFDVSDTGFTLATPTIAVSSPNTNVLWTIGSARTINWSHNLGTSERVNIELSRDGGATWEAIATNVANSSQTTGAQSWVVTGPPTAAARIRVTWTSNGSVTDISNVDFRIQ